MVRALGAGARHAVARSQPCEPVADLYDNPGRRVSDRKARRQGYIDMEANW